MPDAHFKISHSQRVASRVFICISEMCPEVRVGRKIYGKSKSRKYSTMIRSEALMKSVIEKIRQGNASLTYL